MQKKFNCLELSVNNVQSRANIYWLWCLGGFFLYAHKGQLTNNIFFINIIFVDKIWYGEEEIAETSWNGGMVPSYSNLENMFDKNYRSFVHSQKRGGEEGPIVVFKEEIVLQDVKILTRENCCNDQRYYDVCLFADEKHVACTPADFVIGWGKWISFKVKYLYIQN
jgi:hypothetical protein